MRHHTDLLLVRSIAKPPEPKHGWVENTSEAYHSGVGIGSTQLKLLQKSPAHFFAALCDREPKKPSPAMRLGTLAHDFILEGRAPTVAPPLSKNSLAYKEWFERQPDPALICTADELAALREMKRSALDALKYHSLNLEHAEIEVSGYMVDLINEIQLRIRPDARFDEQGVLLDLKTTGDASPDGFRKQAWNLGYHIQAALYLNVANAIAGEERYKEFYWLALETEPPYAATLFRATPALLREGSKAMLSSIELLVSCMEAATYPAYQAPGDIHDLAPPAWVRSEE